MSTDHRAWTVRARDLLFSIPRRLEIYRETVELPDGRVVDDYVQLVAPTFVLVVAETADGQIVLLRQYRHGPRRVHLGLPGGHVEQGEDPEIAARRELLEETGYGGGEWTSRGSFCTAGNQGGSVAYIFRCRGASVQAVPQSGDLEEMSVELLDRSQLFGALAQGEFAVASDIAAVTLAFATA